MTDEIFAPARQQKQKVFHIYEDELKELIGDTEEGCDCYLCKINVKVRSRTESQLNNLINELQQIASQRRKVLNFGDTAHKYTLNLIEGTLQKFHQQQEQPK